MKTNPIITLSNSGFKIANKVWSIPNTYSLTIQSNVSGTATSDALIGTENYQTNLYATPIQGTKLSGWNGNNLYGFNGEPLGRTITIEPLRFGDLGRYCGFWYLNGDSIRNCRLSGDKTFTLTTANVAAGFPIRLVKDSE